MTSRARAGSALAVTRETGGPHWFAPTAFALGFDAAAAAMLLSAAPDLDAAAVTIAACLHLAAALLLAGWPGRDDGRHLLGAAAVLVIPFFGAVIAAAVLTSRGDGRFALARDPRKAGRWRPVLPPIPRFEDLVPSCDALLDGDEERRRAALAGLARRSDPEGMMLLRWAARGDDPDLALLAALALDESLERAGGRTARYGAAGGIRHVAG